MSLEKLARLMELIGRINLVIRGEREWLGTEMTERMAKWSEMDRSVNSTAETMFEVEWVMSRSRVFPEE